MRLLVLHGPNLNLLGTREPEVYGAETLDDLEEALVEAFPEIAFRFVQSNHEGALLDALHEARVDGTDGVVMNAGALSHTSVALRDAVAAIAPLPVVEVHISNVHAREPFRHVLLSGGACAGVISGLGRYGYHAAVGYLLERA